MSMIYETTPDGIKKEATDQDSISFSGYAREAWNELLESASKDELVAQDALRLLYRFSAQGSTE